MGLYDFTVEHQSGVSHGNADAMSRIFGLVDEVDPGGQEMSWFSQSMDFHDRIKLREAQMMDEDIGWLLKAKESGGTRPNCPEGYSRAVRFM